MAQLVHDFETGSKDQKDLLGGKGANLAEMTRLGIPVPPGFTITTEACNSYYDNNKQFPDGLWDQVLAALKDVEQKTGKKLATLPTRCWSRCARARSSRCPV